jgi:pyruvate, orthophosphate dikinase
MNKWVYAFGDGRSEGDKGMEILLGGKGAGLAEMSKLGLPVPPGFSITTAVCTHYHKIGQSYPADLKNQVAAALDKLGVLAGGALGDPAQPLLVSVRSGAPVSMPGMMDTVLNLGLNSATAESLARLSGDTRFAYDSYRRFIQMYADVVLGTEQADFEEILESRKQDKGVELDTALDADDLKAIAGEFKAQVQKRLGKPFPEDVQEQLWGAIGAVFGSWTSSRADTYRRLNNIPEDWGTAVTVQAMVFGNRGETSATGVAFTRDPATGEKLMYGEFLINAQGEDVVAGIRTPQPLSKIMRQRQGGRKSSMEEAMPKAFAELQAIGEKLEQHYRDMQDMEFTVQEGKLFLLQTRTGKRTAEAALKMAVDMVGEGLIDKETAIGRVDAAALDQLRHPILDPEADRQEIAAGLGASPGAITGEVVFTAEEAEELAAQNRSVVLVLAETSPKDIQGLHAAKGFVTIRGGMTSHAAVLARGMGRPCVCGAGSLKIDAASGQMTGNGITVKRGERITIDGAAGKVFKGAVKMLNAERTGDFAILMQWTDDVRHGPDHAQLAKSAD